MSAVADGVPLAELARQLGEHAELASCIVDGHAALHVAASRGRLDVVRYLAEVAQANVHQCLNCTPFFAACYGGHLHVAQYLRDERGADAATPNEDGVSPLLAAIRRDHAHIAHYLICCARVDVDQPGDHGATLLETAVLLSPACAVLLAVNTHVGKSTRCLRVRSVTKVESLALVLPRLLYCETLDLRASRLSVYFGAQAASTRAALASLLPDTYLLDVVCPMPRPGPQPFRHPALDWRNQVVRAGGWSEASHHLLPVQLRQCITTVLVLARSTHPGTVRQRRSLAALSSRCLATLFRALGALNYFTAAPEQQPEPAGSAAQRA